MKHSEQGALRRMTDRLYGGLNMSWIAVIAFAVGAAVLTAVFLIVPLFKNSSLERMGVTLEAWIFFAVILMANCKKPLESACKTFVFFLISQPLIYLLQVPFSSLGWGLFGYYKYWFIWTLLCFPMGYIGYYMKKDKWWGYLILLPMILLTALSYLAYFSDFLFSCPRYILVTLFCAAAMIFYPVVIFENRKIRTFGAAVGILGVAALTVLGLLNPPVYRTEIMVSGSEQSFDAGYSAELEDRALGDVEIVYLDSIEEYAVHADFHRSGSTVLILESPDGEKSEFDLTVERDTYTVTKR